MAKNIKHKPPSRIKYETSNPVISCRVSRNLYSMIQKAREVEGKSFTDLLKIGLREQSFQNNKIHEARDEGYKNGYSDAEQRFKVTYPCSVCGKPLLITSENEKKAAGELMSNAGWGHSECHERK